MGGSYELGTGDIMATEVCLEINKGSDQEREDEQSDTVEPQKIKNFNKSTWKKHLEVVLRVERISPHSWRVFKRKFLFQF